jgi:hypothetical protein
MPATVSADAGPVVDDDDRVVFDLDADHRRRAGLLGSIEGVVGQFLENDPLIGRVPNLFDQFPFGAEVEQPGCPERLSLQDVGGAGGRHGTRPARRWQSPFRSRVAARPCRAILGDTAEG